MGDEEGHELGLGTGQISAGRRDPLEESSAGSLVLKALVIIKQAPILALLQMGGKRNLH